jgi:6-hydroxy-3-succinoylpyridine 3-monooxygenase
VNAENPETWPRYCSQVSIWKVEEKKTDVNLAIHAVKDALKSSIDHIVFATNDTDIAPALEMIRACAPQVIIGLVIPTTNHERRPNYSLQEHAHWTRNCITLQELASAQFPRVIPNKKRAIVKPDAWFSYSHSLASILVMGKEYGKSRRSIFKWLDTPNNYWQGKKPFEILDAGQGDEIIAYLQRYA